MFYNSNYIFETLNVSHVLNIFTQILGGLYPYLINFSISIGLLIGFTIIFMSGKKIGERFLGYGAQLGSIASGGAGLKYLHDEYKKSSDSSSDSGKSSNNTKSSSGNPGGNSSGSSGSSGNTNNTSK